MTDLPPELGYRLASLIDGEGSFCIGHNRRTGTYHPTMQIRLRADDGAILRQFHRETGIGTVHYIAKSNGSNAQVVWQVASNGDASTLARWLWEYPLRSKKQWDALLWIAAVAERDGGKPDWASLSQIKARLEGWRKFEQHPAARLEGAA